MMNEPKPAPSIDAQLDPMQKNVEDLVTAKTIKFSPEEVIEFQREIFAEMEQRYLNLRALEDNDDQSNYV